MKVFIVHDSAGKIIASVIPLPGDLNFGVNPPPGMHLHIFEAADMEEGKSREFQADIHNNHVIDMFSGEPALIKRMRKSGK
jgi:hypothetical protein